jgi:hypothetical protein
MDPSKLRPDLVETICIEDFTLRKEFGRERGKHDLAGGHLVAFVALTNAHVYRLESDPNRGAEGSIRQAEPSATSETEK